MTRLLIPAFTEEKLLYRANLPSDLTMLLTPLATRGGEGSVRTRPLPIEQRRVLKIPYAELQHQTITTVAGLMRIAMPRDYRVFLTITTLIIGFHRNSRITPSFKTLTSMSPAISRASREVGLT